MRKTLIVSAVSTVVVALCCMATLIASSVMVNRALSEELSKSRDYPQHIADPTLEQAVNRDLGMSLDQWIEGYGGSTSFTTMPDNLDTGEHCSPGIPYHLLQPGSPVDPQIIVTASHCVVGRPVYEDSNMPEKYDPGNNDDLAVAYSPAVGIPPAPGEGYITGMSTPRKGDNLCAFGNTSGWRCGPVIETDTYNGNYFTWDAPVAPGDSGGVVYRGREVVGVVSGVGYEDKAFPADTALNRTTSYGIIQTLPESLLDLDLPDHISREPIRVPSPKGYRPGEPNPTPGPPVPLI